MTEMTRDAISQALFEFVKQKGFEAELYDNGYIGFEHDGSEFGLAVDEEDTLCYHVILSNVTQVDVVASVMEIEDEDAAKLGAMSAAMVVMAYTSAKVLIDDENQLDVKIDLLCPSPEVFNSLLLHAMQILIDAGELLLKTLLRQAGHSAG